MGNLLVRNLDDEIIKELKIRAGKHGISAEAEHRRILELVLLKSSRKSFIEVIQQIPDVGEDSDFDRRDETGSTDVFN